MLAVGVLFLIVPLFPLPAVHGADQPPAREEKPGYVGSEACRDCHEEQFGKFARTKMGKLFMKGPRTDLERLSCEACHGPGEAHVAAGGGRGVGGMITFRKGIEPVQTQNAVCLKCHEKGRRLYWQGSAHEARDLACTTCHKVMENVSPTAALAKPTEIEVCAQCHLVRRAQLQRSSHMPLREGKLTCTDCHNPHGTITQGLIPEPSVNENCYRCHADKRGPFLWEHPPVTESCLNCHEPHGSNRAKLLKLMLPRLCQQCHIETRHPTEPRGILDTTRPLDRFTFNRGCVNCHFAIHGSNHPSGFAFTR